MLALVNFAELLFPDFSLILAGFLICRYTPLDRPVWEQVEGLVYYVLFPVLLVQSILKSPLDIGATSSLIGAGLALGAAGIAMAYAVPHLPGLRKYIDAREHAGAAQVAFRFNSYIALAMSERVAGPQGLMLIAVLIGFCVPVVNVGAVWPMARHGGMHLGSALLRNPLIIATTVGLTGNFLGLKIPGFMEQSFTRIGAASLALGLMTAGAGMQFGSLQRAKALAVSLLVIRHVASPLVAWGLAHALQLDRTQTLVLLAYAGLPTAASCYVLAARMGYNGAFVAALVTISTVLGLASLPFSLGVLGGFR
ncbi:AEC family transporter [Ramlibacter albus]|uniref:AEC family transporter n=1 Tax=Ramlibacter albus TaxID=2079448 RepID=A0A923MAV0_9BURK|nr:AEC family transporter [Ramlibacter albus]MBC5765692.1 AEC family transporter [Ramlibacter albus]